MSTSKTPTQDPAVQSERKRVPTHLIDRSEDARPLDESNIERLQKSTKVCGLLHAIVLIALGDRYVCVIGNHRLEAMRRNGADDIEAVVWPEKGTSRKKLLVASMHENNVRKNESMQDVLHRVTTLAAYHECEFPEAARIAGVTESTLSKINQALLKLSQKALDFVNTHKIGYTIAYEVSKAAKDEEQQIKWLTDHLAGKMPRKAIVEAGKANPSGRHPKRVTLDLNIGGVTIKMGVPTEIEYDQLFEVLSTLKRRLTTQSKLNHPVDLLPRLMNEEVV